jgi:hypothetical protein
MISRIEKNARQREYRVANGNLCTKVYEKTQRGFLMRAYRNMLSRVRGIQKLKAHLYREMDVLSRDTFYAWAMASDDFKRLFREWEASGHDRKLTPSVDRRNSQYGYHLSNMRWITHSENSRLGAISPRRSRRDSQIHELRMAA